MTDVRLAVALTSDEARSLTDEIRSRFEDVAPLIARAFAGRIWQPMGYPSWHEYVVGEFGGPLRLGRTERIEAVGDLRQAGLSTRAIGTALGVDHTTVMEDMSGGGNPPPAPVTGLDGKTYRPPALTPEEVEVAADRMLPRNERLELIVSGAMSGLRELVALDPAEVAPLITRQRKSFASHARSHAEYLLRLAAAVEGDAS